VIHEHGEPWWYDIDREKTDSSTRVFWQSYQQSPSSNAGELTKEIINFALRSIFVHTSKAFLTRRKILHGADGFTSIPKEGVMLIFIALKTHCQV
jgi:hypothetical protein